MLTVVCLSFVEEKGIMLTTVCVVFMRDETEGRSGTAAFG